MSLDGIVIIGTGLAGYNLAKNVRALDPNVPITLITQGEGHFYSKPMLSTALAQKKSPADLIVNNRDDMANKYQLTIINNATVYNLCPSDRTVQYTSDDVEKTLHYSKCIFAMGASPKSLDFLPSHKRVFQINQWEDYVQFRKHFAEFKRIAIIGAGLVGCEFAHDLAQVEEVNVHLMTPESHCMARWLHPRMATALQNAFEEKQIQIHTDCQVNHVSTEAELTLYSNHGELVVDAIISAIGIVPNIHVAAKAGIDVDHGIIVNEFCQTNQADIFAIGDCMQFQGENLQFIAPLTHQCQKLAQTLTGNPQALQYNKMPLNLKTPSFPILHLSPNNDSGAWHFESIDNGLIGKFYDNDNQLKGFSLGGKAIALRMKLMQEMA